MTSSCRRSRRWWRRLSWPRQWSTAWLRVLAAQQLRVPEALQEAAASPLTHCTEPRTPTYMTGKTRWFRFSSLFHMLPLAFRKYVYMFNSWFISFTVSHLCSRESLNVVGSNCEGKSRPLGSPRLGIASLTKTSEYRWSKYTVKHSADGKNLHFVLSKTWKVANKAMY